MISKETTLQVLGQFVAGELGWRQACKQLELWDYDELLELLEEHKLEMVLPLREHGTQEALAERIIATLSGLKE